MSAVVASTGELATIANREHAEAEHAYGSLLEHAWLAGDALTQAKELVGHGRFLTWIDEHFAGRQQRASEYMRLRAKYPERGGLPVGVGIRAALAPAPDHAASKREKKRAGQSEGVRPAAQPIDAIDALQQVAADSDALTALERHPDFDRASVVDACEQLIQRLLARARYADTCACTPSQPDGDGGCVHCGKALLPLAAVAS